MEEYQDLLRLQSSERESEGARLSARKRRTPRTRRKGKALPGMKTALRKANQMARKKNGDFKKGWNQSRVMKTAHRIRRRR